MKRAAPAPAPARKSKRQPPNATGRASFASEDHAPEDPFDYYAPPPSKDNGSIAMSFRMDLDQHTLMADILARRLLPAKNSSDMIRTAMYVYLTKYLGGSERAAKHKLGNAIRAIEQEQALAVAVLKSTAIASVVEKYCQAMRNALAINATEVAGKIWLQAELAIRSRFKGPFLSSGLNSLMTRQDIKGAREVAVLLKQAGIGPEVGDAIENEEGEDE